MPLFTNRQPKKHFLSKAKLDRSYGTYTGPHRPNLFIMWPASQKELPTSALGGGGSIKCHMNIFCFFKI